MNPKATMKSTPLKEWAMFVLLGLLWGSSFLWIKVAMGNDGRSFLGIALAPGSVAFGPFALVTVRLFFGALGLAIVLLVQRPTLPREPRVYLAYFFMAVFYAVLPFALITWGETRIDSAQAAILNGTVPLFTIIIAHFWLSDERITVQRVAGLIVGFAGLVILLSRDLGSVSGNGRIWGQVAVLAAAVSYAVSSTFSRRYLRGQSAVLQSFMTLMMADVVMLLVTATAERPIALPTAPIAWIAVIWLGLLNSCLAYVLFFSLVNAWGPTRATLVTYIFPVIGLLFGITLLGETADWRLFAGAALIVFGIVVVNLRSKRNAKITNEHKEHQAMTRDVVH